MGHDRNIPRLDADGRLHTCTADTVRREWWVECPPASIERMNRWKENAVIPPLLQTLRQIPNLLVPTKLPEQGEKGYSAQAPKGGGTWFEAKELQGSGSLHERGLTVMALWSTAAAMCETLEQMLQLGVWSCAGRETMLLCGGEDRNFCFTRIPDYNIFCFPQTFPEHPGADKNPITTAFRRLLGGLSLCMDGPDLDKAGYSPLEEELGSEHIGDLSAFFRTPSQLEPLPFLREAQSLLSSAAARLRWTVPQELHLYVVLLGSSCCQADVPELSNVVRTFQQCLGILSKTYRIPETKATYLFPWNRVQICDCDPEIVPGISVLARGEAVDRDVPWGGLLDCLNIELERNLKYGSAPLVCCIELQDDRNTAKKRGAGCMEEALMERLKRRQRLGVFEMLLLGRDSWRISRIMDRLYTDQAQIVTRPEELGYKMHSALERLLKQKRYSWPD